MKKIIARASRSKFLGAIFHTLDYCLQRELGDCTTVLDLGCGPSSPVQYCKNIERSVGIDIFRPYLDAARQNKTHDEYIEDRAERVDFPEGSFDAVVLVEVLEHLPKSAGLEILKKAERWAKKKIFISTPNGFFPMEDVDSNTFQRHLSGWDVDDFKKMGYVIRGTAGAKFFYKKRNSVSSLLKGDFLFANMRFRPKPLFFAINSLTQIATHYLPKYAFGLIAVKNIKKNV